VAKKTQKNKKPHTFFQKKLRWARSATQPMARVEGMQSERRGREQET
jgi:hypothetical protein